MSETQSEEDSRVRELQEELSRLRALKDFAGYKYLLEIADNQIKGRQDALILRPLAKMDDVLSQEYSKGEIAGIRLFRELTDIRIADLEEEIARATQEDEQDGTGTDNAGFDPTA